jgi:hypothetical protein
MSVIWNVLIFSSFGSSYFPPPSLISPRVHNRRRHLSDTSDHQSHSRPDVVSCTPLLVHRIHTQESATGRQFGRVSRGNITDLSAQTHFCGLLQRGNPMNFEVIDDCTLFFFDILPHTVRKTVPEYEQFSPPKKNGRT